MKNYLLAVVAMTLLASNASAESCDVKPLLKTYKPSATATLPLSTLTGLKLKVEQPKALGISDAPMLVYADDRLISFQYWGDSVEGSLKPDALYLGVFGVTNNIEEKDLIGQIRKEMNIRCNSPVTEIKIFNSAFRAFMTRMTKDYINVYLIPTSGKGYLHFVQFRGYSENEVGEIISTIQKGI